MLDKGGELYLFYCTIVKSGRRIHEAFFLVCGMLASTKVFVAPSERVSKLSEVWTSLNCGGSLCPCVKLGDAAMLVYRPVPLPQTAPRLWPPHYRQCHSKHPKDARSLHPSAHKVLNITRHNCIHNRGSTSCSPPLNHILVLSSLFQTFLPFLGSMAPSIYIYI